MEARNRILKDWYGKVQRGEIKLPRFQRHEAWDRQRISSLIETVVHDLPLGITLTLEVGDKEKFISRFLETTTPKEGQRVLEHLLDGQQRLTALWRAFHNNYEWETYFIYIKEFDNYEGPMKGKGSDFDIDSAEKLSVHPSRASGRTAERSKSLEIFPFMLSLSKHSWGFSAESISRLS